LSAARDLMEEVARMTLMLVTQDKEKFDAAVANVRAADPSFDAEDMPTFEKMHLAIRNGDLAMKAQQGAVVELALSPWDTAFNVLMTRTNIIVEGGSTDDGLLTSSRPVLLTSEGKGPVGLRNAHAVMMAISPNRLFMSIVGSPGAKWMPAPVGLFKQFNVLLAAQSQMVFGEEKMVRSVVDFMLTAEPGPKAKRDAPTT
jgi:hypothetical protein